jgi:hypothetical protein
MDDVSKLSIPNAYASATAFDDRTVRVTQPDTISVSQPSESRKLENTPELSVLRIKHPKRGWVPIPRALIDDTRLQFDTRAMASWLIAKPSGWKIRLVALPYSL